MKPIISLIGHVLKEKWGVITIFIVLLALYLIDVLSCGSLDEVRKSAWIRLSGDYLSIGTFTAAFLAWFLTAKREWHEKLPKKLTTYFLFEEKIVLAAYNAHLSGESDIRALGQQIGMQLCNGQRLSFDALSLVSKEVSVVYKKNKFCGGKMNYPFRHHVLVVKLEKLPEIKEDLQVSTANYTQESIWDEIKNTDGYIEIN